MAELLPCPFCGSKNVCCGDAGCNNFWYVQCDDCFATFPHFDTKKEALEAWNTRTPVATEPITYGCSLGLKGALSYARTLPTADVAEVRHGKWVHTDYAMHWLGKDECSECTYHTSDRDDLSHFNFCPNCGAKMDKGVIA